MAAANNLDRFGGSAAVFVRGLYEEHLDEASFLYERWHSSYENPWVPWDELTEVAARLDYHLDALHQAGTLAVELLRERVAEATAVNPGILYAATCLHGRQGRFDRFADLAVAMHPEDDAGRRAVEDALVQATPPDWMGKMGRLFCAASDLAHQDDTHPGHLAEPNSALALALVGAIGHLRLPLADEIQKALEGKVADPAPYLWALSRLNHRQAAAVLMRYAQGTDAGARQAAFLSAVHLGIVPAVAQLQQIAQEETAGGLGSSRDTAALAHHGPASRRLRRGAAGSRDFWGSR